MSERFSTLNPTTTNTQRQLLSKQLQVLNNGGGGGGGGSNNFTSSNLGGSAPATTPSGNAWIVDTSNNHLWAYFSGAWHDTGVYTA
jgi:hypothetical protein